MTFRAFAVLAIATLSACGGGGATIPSQDPPAQPPPPTSAPTSSPTSSPPVSGSTPAPTAAPTSTPVPAPSATAVPTATPTPGVTPSGTTIWQAGSPGLGGWILANTYQCGSPAQSGTTFSFTLTRSGTNCGRNQAQPTTSSGQLSTLQPGHTYTWTFHYIDGTPNGASPGMGRDSEAQSLIWQMHDFNASGPAASLGFTNASNGAQVWDFSLGGTPLYVWTGAYTPGETDDWKIVVDVSNTASGTEALYRNGVEVFTARGANYSSSANPWWNFGPYKWRWELPGGGSSDMSTIDCTIENMVLTEQ